MATHPLPAPGAQDDPGVQRLEEWGVVMRRVLVSVWQLSVWPSPVGLFCLLFWWLGSMGTWAEALYGWAFWVGVIVYAGAWLALRGEDIRKLLQRQGFLPPERAQATPGGDVVITPESAKPNPTRERKIAAFLATSPAKVAEPAASESADEQEPAAPTTDSTPRKSVWARAKEIGAAVAAWPWIKIAIVGVILIAVLWVKSCMDEGANRETQRAREIAAAALQRARTIEAQSTQSKQAEVRVERLETGRAETAARVETGRTAVAAARRRTPPPAPPAAAAEDPAHDPPSDPRLDAMLAAHAEHARGLRDAAAAARAGAVPDTGS